MLAFVDESGDSGMDCKEGTSKYFVVSAVLFEDHDEATACDRGINAIRSKLRFPERQEFHFNKCERSKREYFLREVSAFNFFYLAVVIDKGKLCNPHLKEKASFYNYTVGLVFENAKPHLNNTIVMLDRSGGLEFRQKLASYLKKKICEGGGKPLLKKVKMEPSHNNNLLRLADMVCGAVARSFREDKADRDIYRKLLRHRELRVESWPK